MVVRPGDPLRITASDWNAAVAAGKTLRDVGGRLPTDQRSSVRPGVAEVHILKGVTQPEKVKPGEFCTFSGLAKGWDDADKREGGPLQFVTHGPIYPADDPYNTGAYGVRWLKHGIAVQQIEASGAGSGTPGVLVTEGLLWVWARIVRDGHNFVRPAEDPRVMDTSYTHGHRIDWQPTVDVADLPAERWMLVWIRPEPICPVRHGTVIDAAIRPGQGGKVRLRNGEEIEHVLYDHITGSGAISVDVKVNVQYWVEEQRYMIVDADCEQP